MKRFVKNLILFTAMLLVVLVLFAIPYIIADPYMDFGKKQNYSWKYSFQALGDVATKKLLNSSHEYNSFVFGSSRTTGIYACYLNSVIPDAFFFHYGNWNETIGGIKNKLELIDSLGYEIDNVIIFIDTDYTFEEDGECRHSDHYMVTKTGKFQYLKTHFKRFYRNMTLDKMKILMGLEVKGEVFPNWTSDLITNDPKHNCSDPDILSNYETINDSENLVEKIEELKTTGYLFERPLNQQYKEDQISENEKNILLRIQKIFIKHSTTYHIVITPLYDQLKLSITDQEFLANVFGHGLIDFSGINSYTNNEYNYPDRKHFQPYISKNILDSLIHYEQTTRNMAFREEYGNE